MPELQVQNCDTSYGKLRVHTCHIPKEKSRKSVLLIPGWSETVEGLLSFIEELHQKGVVVHVPDFSDLDYDNSDNTLTPSPELSKALALHQYVDSLDSDIHIIGHSEGAVTACYLGVVCARKVESIILIAPAGLVESDSFFKLSSRFFLFFLKQVKYAFITRSKRAQKYVTASLRYMFLNPFQVSMEALGLPKIKLKKIVRGLVKKGVRVSIVLQKDDEVFPFEEVRGQLAHIENVHIYEIPGGHNGLNTNPISATELISEIIN